MTDQRVPTSHADDIEEIREQAADWILKLDQAEPADRERLEAECRDWQAVDPRRGRVLDQMARMWSAVEPAGGRRRKAGVLGFLLFAAVLLAGQLPWNVWTADYRTATGEIREITLPDGSRAVLNTGSAIDVDYGDGRRTIVLQKGELLVTVESDRDGPEFSVVTEHGQATALGTHYAVRRMPEHAVVTVYESSVRLDPAATGTNASTLSAGQRATLSADGISPAQPVGQNLPDWSEGRLVFNDVALEQVVERLARYRSGWLLLDDELAGKGLRFTGVLPADDSDAALKLLAESLSLDIEGTTPYMVRVRERR